MRTLLRVTTRYALLDEFLASFARFAHEDALFVASAHTRAKGTAVDLEVRLSDGRPVLKGSGEIATVHTRKDGPEGENGVMVRLTEMDVRSREIHRQLKERRRRADDDIDAMLDRTLSDSHAEIEWVDPEPVAPVTEIPTRKVMIPDDGAIPVAVHEQDTRRVPAMAEALPIREDVSAPPVPGPSVPVPARPPEIEPFPTDLGSPAFVPAPTPVAPLRQSRTPIYVGLAAAAVVIVLVVWKLAASGSDAPPPARTDSPPAAVSAPSPSSTPSPSAKATDAERSCMASITSTPPGASIRWGDKDLGRTPLMKLTVPCGDAVVRFALLDHLPVEVLASAKPGTPLKLDRRLVKPGVKLSLQSDPPGATFHVNGALVGVAPASYQANADQELAVEATLAGHKPWRQTVVAKGKTMEIRARLEGEGSDPVDEPK